MSDEATEKKRVKKEPPEFTEKEAAECVASILRFTSRLGDTSALSQLPLAEWSALRAFEEKGSITGAKLALALGVSRQRATIIAGTLREKGYVGFASSGTAKAKPMELTEKGRDALREINASIFAMFSGRAKMLRGAARSARRLTRNLAPSGKKAGRTKSKSETSDD